MLKITESPTRVVGAAPFVRAMANDIGLIDLLNHLLAWDCARTRISPGERILGLV